MKTNFYKKVYLHVALAVVWFLIAEYFMLHSEIIVNTMLSMLEWYRRLLILWWFAWVTYLAEKMATNNSDKLTQYMALWLYVIAEALLFVPIIFIAISYTQDMSLLLQATVVTLALFWWISAVAFTTKKDFSFLRSALIVWTFVAMWLIIAWVLFWFTLWLLFSVLMVILAWWSILYNTSNIIHKYNEDQYIVAALWLFSSLMLLFWYILRIFMSRD